MKNLIKLIASFFYLGYLPVSGTLASFATLLIYLLIRDNFALYTVALIAATGLGLLCCGRAERVYQEKDPSKIVIDEVAGMLLAFYGLQLDWTLLIVGFFIYRALDMVKAYPADKIEKMGGSLGVMGDDLIAGAYTNITLTLVTRIFI